MLICRHGAHLAPLCLGSTPLTYARRDFPPSLRSSLSLSLSLSLSWGIKSFLVLFEECLGLNWHGSETMHACNGFATAVPACFQTGRASRRHHYLQATGRGVWFYLQKWPCDISFWFWEVSCWQSGTRYTRKRAQFGPTLTNALPICSHAWMVHGPEGCVVVSLNRCTTTIQDSGSIVANLYHADMAWHMPPLCTRVGLIQV